MIYHRGNRLDYDTWKELGNEGWSWDDVKPYFEKSLETLRVDRFRNYDPFMEIIEKAASQLGQKLLEMFDEDNYIGYARSKSFASKGRRMSTGKVFLAAVKDRSNLHIIKNSVAKRIFFNKNGSRAESVEFVYRNSQIFHVKAKKEIILSAGTIGTAKLLLLSGIGPEEHLTYLNIPLIKHLSVGQNLQNHVRVPIFFSYRDKEYDPVTILDHMENYLIHNKGPLTTRSMIFLQGFINSDPESNSSYPDVQFSHFISKRGSSLISDIHRLRYEIMNSIKEAENTSSIYQVDTILLRPKSVGWMELQSNNYLKDPLIFPNYFDNQNDLEIVKRGLKFQLKFQETEAFQKAGADIIQLKIPECMSFYYGSDEHLTCYITHMSANAYHSSGTAKMGPTSDPNSVVGNTLKVHGVSGLRIGDASVMPNIVSGNTAAATIMIAEMLSDFVKEEYS